MVNKNDAVIAYLKTCPEIAEHSLFFNFAEKEDDNHLFATYADSTETIRNYVDGSRELRYTFTIIVYKSVAYNELIAIHLKHSPLSVSAKHSYPFSMNRQFPQSLRSATSCLLQARWALSMTMLEIRRLNPTCSM